MIHVYASQANYWRHLAPIVDELRARGHEVSTWAARAFQPWGARIPMNTRPPAQSGEVTIVASWIDARKWPRIPLVHVEHGAGQTYQDGRPEGYAGAQGLAEVRLFLCPGEHVAERWRAIYPQAVAVAVGCPALDQHHGAPAARNGQTGPLVAVTAHWTCGVNPETMPALPPGCDRALKGAYERKIVDLADTGTTIIGHAHPRATRRAGAWWETVGIPIEIDPDVVLAALRNAQHATLVADNTSLMYEAAALGIPTVAVNAPTYRRDVEHGLRFWSHVPGLQVDSPTEFRATVDRALADPEEAQELRRRAAEHVYAHRDGSSSRRAADEIERVL